MAEKKLTRDEIKELLDKWGGLRKRLDLEEKKRTKAMSPVIERHAAELAEATAEHDEKISKLSAQEAPLRTQIQNWLLTHKKALTVEGAKAKAALTVHIKLGARQAEAKDFIAAAKGKGEDDIYACLKVLVEAGENLIGKEAMDEIATKPETEVKTAGVALI